MADDDNKLTADNNQPPVFDDQETKDKISRHLSDINDTITEQDIENVQTEINPHYDHDPYESEEKEKKDETSEDAEIPASIDTPWNILGAAPPA